MQAGAQRENGVVRSSGPTAASRLVAHPVDECLGAVLVDLAEAIVGSKYDSA
jgi:hypothetical protein